MQEQTSNKGIAKKRRKKGGKAQWKGYLFVAPLFVLLTVFTIYPMFFSLGISFTDWDFLSGISGIRFAGLDNYREMFSDVWFRDSLINTIFYTIMYVPVTIILSFLVALFLNDKVFGAKVMRLCFYIPNISSIAAVSILWSVIYSSSGPIHAVCDIFGVEAPNFLADVHWALPSIVIMSVWMSLGYCSLIYVAGLQGIPQDVLESAEIDGAGAWTKMTRITLPMLFKTTFFLTITQVTNSFMVFGQIQIMTGGGPIRSTSVLGYYIYQSAFVDYRFGYASAMAVVLFLIILVFTLVQWKMQSKFDY